MAKMSWKGVGDARPSSSTNPEKGQGGHDPVSADWKGIQDGRPSSGTKSQSINMGDEKEPKVSQRGGM